MSSCIINLLSKKYLVTAEQARLLQLLFVQINQRERLLDQGMHLKEIQKSRRVFFVEASAALQKARERLPALDLCSMRCYDDFLAEIDSDSETVASENSRESRPVSPRSTYSE